MSDFKCTVLFLSSLFVLLSSSSYAMVFDNRFFPLLQRPYITIDERPSHFAWDIFAATASKAVGRNDDNEINIPELHGFYDQGKLADSFVQIGKKNPLRSEFRGVSIPWEVKGKIQAQGFTLSYLQSVSDLLSLGFYCMFMRVNAQHEFILHKEKIDLENLGEGDLLELDQTRRRMHRELGLGGAQGDQLGMGDFDFYLQLARSWDYMLKFRKIYAGIRCGILVPIGEKRKVDCPTSVPFGGDGHWGFYVSGNAEFELKEDWKAGFLLRLSKRFERIRCERIPVDTDLERSLRKNGFVDPQPHIFASTVGDVSIDPGFTFVFSPYFSVENIRDGLGMRILYTLTTHDNDMWEDARRDKTIPVNLRTASRLSSWGSDYITLNVFYDFGKVKVDRGFLPIVTLAWDVPAAVSPTKRVSKTHKVSLGVEFSF